MYLKASDNPEFNPMVQTLQYKLNVIRTQIHGEWSHLATDGLFGKQTKKAVIAFQIYRGIIPISGDIGDTTLKYIDESYNKVPMIQSRLDLRSGNNYGIDFDLKSFSINFSSQLAGVLNDVSDNLTKQLKWFRSRGVNAKDIDMLLHNMFEKPNVKQMRTEIEKSLFEKLKEVSKKNTNPNYHRVSNVDVLRIREAQRQVSKRILNNQNRMLVEKKLAQNLSDKIVQELESANLKNKISAALKSNGGPKVSGGVVLTTIMLAPMFFHICSLIDACINGKPIEELLNKVVADIISFMEGVLIGLAVAAIVAALGTVGWIAVAIVLVISIIVGIILELIFPNHAAWLAEKVINSTKRIAVEFNALFHSSVFQETAITSYR